MFFSQSAGEYLNYQKTSQISGFLTLSCYFGDPFKALKTLLVVEKLPSCPLTVKVS